MTTIFHFCLTSLLLSGASIAQRSDGQYWPCNPLKNATGACTPNRGLTSSTYSVDFTKQTALPQDWSISNYATVNYGALGAEFTFAKRYDAPQIWTNFYILFGKVKVVMRVANGTGIISSAVLISDVFDEIDYEFSGNNFGNAGSAGLGQNNYFGKGITGTYDRGSYFNVQSPQYSFHSYEVDWTPTSLTWLVDGTVVRTLLLSQTDSGTHQYPQTPSKLQLGLWDGGDPSQNSGTRTWAGGLTDFGQAPFTFYVKSVEIENMYPAAAYNYTDQSGRWQSIKLLQSDPNPSSTTAQPSLSLNAPVANSSVPNSSMTSNSATGTLSSPGTGPATSTSSSAVGTPSTSAVGTMIPVTSTSSSSPLPLSHGSSTASTASVSTPSGSRTVLTMSTIPGSGSTVTTSSLSVSIAQTSSSVKSSVKSSLQSSGSTASTTGSKTIASPSASTSCTKGKSPTLTSSQRKPESTSTTTSTKCTSQIEPTLGWLGWLGGLRGLRGHGADWDPWGVRHGRLPVFRVDHG